MSSGECLINHRNRIEYLINIENSPTTVLITIHCSRNIARNSRNITFPTQLSIHQQEFKLHWIILFVPIKTELTTKKKEYSERQKDLIEKIYYHYKNNLIKDSSVILFDDIEIIIRPLLLKNGVIMWFCNDNCMYRYSLLKVTMSWQ